MSKPPKEKPGLKVVSSGPPGEGAGKQGVVRKADFIDRVASGSKLKKNQVKDATETILTELGRALDRGEELALPPLGRLKLVKRKDQGGNEIITLRLRRLRDAATVQPVPDDDGDDADDSAD